MSFWAINDVVVNTALAEIVDGCDPLDCARLQEAVDGQLKERCGTRIVCLSIEWVQSALAHCARMRAYEKGDAVEWSMLFWDAAQAANLIARHILPALAPHALLLDSFELDMRDYAYARRMHGMSGLGFRDIQSDPLTGCGLLEIGMTLYTGRPYERRTTAKVPINYY